MEPETRETEAAPRDIEGLTGVGRRAVASIVPGTVGLFAWLIPVVGFPVNIVGLILGIQRMKSVSRRKATVGVALCAIGLTLSIIHASNGSHPPARSGGSSIRTTSASTPPRTSFRSVPVSFRQADATRLARTYKNRIVSNHYDGGLYVEAAVKSFHYDARRATRNVYVQLQWQGAMTGFVNLFSEKDVAKTYVARGWLSIGRNTWTWKEEYVNKELAQWRALKTGVRLLDQAIKDANNR